MNRGAGEEERGEKREPVQQEAANGSPLTP